MKALPRCLLVAMLLPGWALAAQPAPDCKLSIYAPGPDQSSLGERIVSPDQVISARYDKSDIIDGGTVLRVRLTPSGALASRAFAMRHIGGKMAILCGSEVLVRAVIEGQGGATFVIENIKRP